jgi:TorA maturation chaperone TorD
LSQFFLHPPDEGSFDAIRQDFSLESTEPLEEIEEDFDRLFSYPHGRLQPIESLSIPTSGAPYEEVISFYTGAGLAIDEAYEVSPDHLSLELLFMSYLIENNKTELEKKFLEQHLMNWVPYYCDEVMKQSKTSFYREIAEIVKDFLTAEYDEYID